MEGRPFERPITTPGRVTRSTPWPLRAVRWLASGGMVVAVLWTVAIALSNKQAVDVYPLAMLSWLAVSFLAIRRVRQADSYIVAVAALLLADALADVLGQGAWLYGLWDQVNQISQAVVSIPLIVEWRWDLGATANLPTFDLAFWSVAVSLRTVALIAGVVEGAVTRERTPRRRWLWVPPLLLVGTAALYIGHVADVLRLMLLAYPPFLRQAPLGFADLPPFFGFTWNTTRIDALAGLSLIVAGLLFERAVAIDRAAMTDQPRSRESHT